MASLESLEVSQGPYTAVVVAAGAAASTLPEIGIILRFTVHLINYSTARDVCPQWELLLTVGNNTTTTCRCDEL